MADLTRRTYETNYIEIVRVKLHTNLRIPRIYFADRLYVEYDKPDEHQLPIGHVTSEQFAIYTFS